MNHEEVKTKLDSALLTDQEFAQGIDEWAKQTDPWGDWTALEEEGFFNDEHDHGGDEMDEEEGEEDEEGEEEGSGMEEPEEDAENDMEAMEDD